MRNLTERQEEVLTFMGDYIREHSYPPTIRELANFFSISVKGAHDHVTALKKKGFLRQQSKQSRTIELVNKPFDDDFAQIPLLGTVAAGNPVVTEENRDGTVVLHRSMLKKKTGDYFALRVRGDSMEGAGIRDGDTAVIEKRDTVANGEIAVVMTDEAVTIKTFFRESTRIRLQPANPKFSPIYCTGDVKVLGRLAHIIRSY